MKYYFHLQYKRIHRKIAETGLPPLVAYVLIGIGFVVLSKALFSSIEYAEWIYLLLGLSVVGQLGEQTRNDILIALYPKASYYQIRILENVILILPFTLVWCVEGFFLHALASLILAIALVVLGFRQKVNMTLPTPFWKIPFEFIVGFRKTIWVYPLVVFLMYKAIEVDNFNLGVFGLAVLFFISMSFYLKPESRYFVWIYNTDTNTFLRKKIKTAILGVTLWTLPVLAILVFAFSENSLFILAAQLLGYLFLVAAILAKYSAFPNEISLPQAILFALSLWFPPLLILVMLLFYRQAKKRLNPILE